MSGEHAKLAPSFAPVWANCSGSVLASSSVIDTETQQSREGTAAHWVGAECLIAWRDAAEGCPSTSDWIGKTAENGVIIDSKMAEGASILVQDVLDVAQQHGALRAIMIEHRVHMPQIHPENWGTLDVCIWFEGGGVLYVWDYKHGHRETRAEGNWQMIDYVAGLYNELKIDGLQDQLVTVRMRIVQPFCYTSPHDVDEWAVKLSELRGYFNQLHAKAHEALSDSPTMTSGKHCRDCAAVGPCAVSRRGRYSYIDYVNEPYEMDNMNDADLAVERGILRDGLAAARARLEAIEDELAHRVSGGSTGSGLALKTNPGRLKWTVPVEQAIAFVGAFGVDVSVPGALTPTQSTEKIPAAMRPAFKQAVEAITTRPPGSLKLTQAGDTIAARAFKRK